jgi:hypothetical protein
MTNALDWLKAAPTSFVGPKYAPYVEGLSFMVVAVIFVNVLVRLLSRPSMIGLAQRTWSLLKEADSAVKYKTQYAPEAEHFRRRVAPYGDLVMHVIGAAVASLFIVVLAMVALRIRRELKFTFCLRCRSVTTWPATKRLQPG